MYHHPEAERHCTCQAQIDPRMHLHWICIRKQVFGNQARNIRWVKDKNPLGCNCSVANFFGSDGMESMFIASTSSQLRSLGHSRDYVLPYQTYGSFRFSLGLWQNSEIEPDRAVCPKFDAVTFHRESISANSARSSYLHLICTRPTSLVRLERSEWRRYFLL